MVFHEHGKDFLHEYIPLKFHWITHCLVPDQWIQVIDLMPQASRFRRLLLFLTTFALTVKQTIPCYGRLNIVPWSHYMWFYLVLRKSYSLKLVWNHYPRPADSECLTLTE